MLVKHLIAEKYHMWPKSDMPFIGPLILDSSDLMSLSSQQKRCQKLRNDVQDGSQLPPHSWSCSCAYFARVPRTSHTFKIDAYHCTEKSFDWALTVMAGCLSNRGTDCKELSPVTDSELGPFVHLPASKSHTGRS